MKKIPVIIADESSITRNGLKVMLAKNSLLEIKEKSRSVEETLQKLEKLKKAVVIADPLLPGIDPVKLPVIVKERYPDAVLILCSHTYDDTCMELLKNKTIDAYLTKNTTGSEIEEAARAALEKKPFTGRAVNEAVARLHLQDGAAPQKTKAALSQREEEVKYWMLRGFLIEEIAEKLFISTGTASRHRKRALEKMRIKGEGHLILDALQKGIITVEEIRKWKLK
jgi:DNA-binding NarL/FixJ family response regulator